MDELEKRKLDILNADLETLKQTAKLLENIFKIDEQLVPTHGQNNLGVEFDYRNVSEFVSHISEEIKKLEEDILTEKLAIISKHKKHITTLDVIERIDDNIDQIDSSLGSNNRCTDNPCPIEFIKSKVNDYQKLQNIAPETIEKLATFIHAIEKFEQQIDENAIIADNLSAFSEQFKKVDRTKKEKIRKWFCCCCFGCCKKHNERDNIDANESDRLESIRE